MYKTKLTRDGFLFNISGESIAIKRFYDFFCWMMAVALVFPFYFGITASGLTFPIESISFEGLGIPVPISLPLIIVSTMVAFVYKKGRLGYGYLLVVYFLFLASVSNWLRVVQVVVCFFYLFVFASLRAQIFYLLFKRTIISGIILYEIHAISFLYSVLVVGLNLHHGFESIYKIPVYSPFISYVSGIIIISIGACFMGGVIRSCASAVALPLLLFSQRTLALFFIPIVFVVNRWYSLLAFSLGILIVLGIFFYPEVTFLFARTVSKLNGADGGLVSGRPEAWLAFAREINSFKDVFLGVHRFDIRPHNYWLQLINVGGAPLFVLMGCFFAKLLFKAWAAMKGVRTCFAAYLIWFLLDTNINSPLTQPYTIGLAMLMLVAMIRRDEYVRI